MFALNFDVRLEGRWMVTDHITLPVIQVSNRHSLHNLVKANLVLNEAVSLDN